MKQPVDLYFGGVVVTDALRLRVRTELVRRLEERNCRVFGVTGRHFVHDPLGIARAGGQNLYRETTQLSVESDSRGMRIQGWRERSSSASLIAQFSLVWLAALTLMWRWAG